VTTLEIMKALAEPFAPDEVDWRVGSTNSEKTSGLALAYIDARAAADRFDAVCGAGWRCSYPTILRSMAEGKRGSICVCRIELKLDGEWVGRENGAGDTAHEAEKGALSDAFKRAATLWGVGRYLYGFESPWVKIVAFGRSYKIAKEEWPKLHKLSADALARYRANPAAFRAPVPDDPPEKATFAPAAQAPARPEPPKAAPKSEGQHPLVAKLHAASTLEDVRALVVRGRDELRHGPDAEELERELVAKILDTIPAAAARGPEAVEDLAKWIGMMKPAKSGVAPIRAALDKARREAQAS
jgi:hypothetical protein